jgi:hypothetical protein
LKPIPLLQQSLFFFGFASTKVAKTTKQNKTNFLTNTKKTNKTPTPTPTTKHHFLDAAS